MTSLPLSLAVLALCQVVGAQPPNMCMGKKPMKPLLYRADYAVADNICCHNHHWAEFAGYAESVHFWQNLDKTKVTIFYDSVCGLPLFKFDPSVRSFAAWKLESHHHGWPSFRPSETFKQNIHFVNGGEMVSKCGTHLGHNLPDGQGDRYCINLVCMAGSNKAGGLTTTPPTTAAAKRIPVYFGAGCYWHTNYDMYVAESKPPFSRSGVQITSHIGYGGGPAPGPGGLVCYHGGPRGTLYEDLHYAESTEVVLDGDKATQQFKALLGAYFEEFTATKMRQDPQDAGPPYRNNIGIPGGIRGALYPLIVAANKIGMTLKEGKGAADLADELVIYIYDTTRFKFYRGEQYHQFHANVVLGRPVPSSYLVDLKRAQGEAGLINPTGCPELNYGSRYTIIRPVPAKVAAAKALLSSPAAAAANPSCTTQAQFEQLSQHLDQACCHAPGSACAMGMPMSCTPGCAQVLRPLHRACTATPQDFLNSAVAGVSFKAVIESALQLCATSGH